MQLLEEESLDNLQQKVVGIRKLHNTQVVEDSELVGSQDTLDSLDKLVVSGSNLHNSHRKQLVGSSLLVDSQEVLLVDPLDIQVVVRHKLVQALSLVRHHRLYHLFYLHPHRLLQDHA